MSDLKPAPMEARILLRDTVVDDANQIYFPVDPIAIARDLDIKVQTAPLQDNVAGLIVKTDDSSPVQIMLNANDHETRQRFTCAHELGHFIKRTKGGGEGLIGFVDYRNEVAGRGTDPEEIWANGFAAELLMPSFAIRRYWAEGTSPAKMARTFGVSPAAMDVRLSALGLS